MSTRPPAPRRLRPYAVLLAALTSAFAIVTLLGLEPLSALPATTNDALRSIAQLFIQLAAVVGALAVFIGVLNLTRVQARALRRMPRGLFALVTLLTLVAVLAVRIFERAGTLRVDGLEATATSLTLLDSLQVATESALAGLLFFALVAAAFRLLRRGVTLWNALFLAALLIVLIGYNPPGGVSLLSNLRTWLLDVPVTGGTRGLLIGVALGTLTVGLRALVGRERTFRDERE